MFDFIKKSPFGFILALAGVVLVASPEAREALRKTAVKATAAVLDLADKAKKPSTAPPVSAYIPGDTGVGAAGAVVSENSPEANPT